MYCFCIFLLMNVNVVKIFGYWRLSLLSHYGMSEPSIILQI